MSSITVMPDFLFDRILLVLQAREPEYKCQLTQQLYDDWCAHKLVIDHQSPVLAIGDAGRPDKPGLVAPREVPRRTISTEQGRVILAHALAHIEFNAINLALDAAYRFRNMPDEYYTDWLRVAAEEAYHFGLLRGYLHQHHHEYGDFDAHNGLWEMAQKTAHDVMVRMALVPRVMEARGLDVTPGLMHKLQQFGDTDFVAHMEIIHRDEIGHVTIGSRWFKYICEQRGLDARATFRQLIEDYMRGSLKGPFDEVVRIQAGFSEEEIADLREMEL